MRAALGEAGFSALPPAGRHGVWGRSGQLVAIAAAVKSWVSYFGAYLNVSPPMQLTRGIRTDRAASAPMSSLAQRADAWLANVGHARTRGPAPGSRIRLPRATMFIPAIRCSSAGRNPPGKQPPVLDSLPIIELPSASASTDHGSTGHGTAVHANTAQPRLPRWLKRNVPKGNANHFTANLLEELRLETVCDNAKCPNRMECYSQKTATFMILGNVCTRPCGFCAWPRARRRHVEDDEPERLAEASRRLGLKHVVITCVTRDDLPDGGAEHFYRCVLAVRASHRRRGRSAHARLPGQARGDRARGRGRARGVQSQHGNRAAPVSRGPRPQERLPLDARIAAPGSSG